MSPKTGGPGLLSHLVGTMRSFPPIETMTERQEAEERESKRRRTTSSGRRTHEQAAVNVEDTLTEAARAQYQSKSSHFEKEGIDEETFLFG